MPQNGAGPASNGNLRNLDTILLDTDVPTTVHLKFKHETDVYEAFNETWSLLYDFYLKEFESNNPYPGVKKMEFKKGTRKDRNEIIEDGYLTLLLSGKKINWLFHGKRSVRQEEEFILAFFNLSPSTKEGFNYQMRFSRRENDFTTHRYGEDGLLSRQDSVKFCRYINGLLENKAVVAPTGEQPL